MLNGIFRKKSEDIDPVRAKIIAQMLETDVDSAEFKEQMNHLQGLAVVKAGDSKSGPSPDTLAIVLANLAGIVIIVGYEHAHVAGSRALGLLLRTKLQ